MTSVQIAIDGPAGSGKSTIAKKVSDIKGITYLDTGAMYRAITLKLMNEGIAFDNHEMIRSVLGETEIAFKDNLIFMDGKDISDAIRMPRVSENVSKVAKLAYVREDLVRRQQEIAESQNIVMDGRDIGTKVLPDASLKFFLTASVDERANRRYLELVNKGVETTFDEVKTDMIRRDKEDSEREASPLVKADDAIEIDTTGLSIEEVTEKIIDAISKEGKLC